jgi:hypothetical protein
LHGRLKKQELNTNLYVLISLFFVVQSNYLCGKYFIPGLLWILRDKKISSLLVITGGSVKARSSISAPVVLCHHHTRLGMCSAASNIMENKLFLPKPQPDYTVLFKFE